MHSPGYIPPSFEQIVETFGLIILREAGDFSTENGDLVMTKDFDIKVGDTVYNALFRLVQAWRLNDPHLRFLFGLMGSMFGRTEQLADETNKIGNDQSVGFDIYDFPAGEFISAFRAAIDKQHAAQYGYATYAGCVVLLLRGSLSRYKNDIDATQDDWNKAAPLFNGYSVGQVIVAAANGFRHDDEWAKTRPATPQQKASQRVLTMALPSTTANHERMPGRCPEVLAMLSEGGDFDRLAQNLFAFAHNLALQQRVARP